ncbi:CidA/LrgA family protein [Sutcliffiella horikoshii]|uniref:CidA/LrgA family protein n=1 Tax=Sutcliffiella horikoshii TaxID=79883 RepID=UPI001EEEC351|nr:CidA/LrgA family protein [Sutcliffiella horikoshii]
MKLVVQICILYVFYRVGVFIQDVFSIPVPGSIIGMLLLLLFLKTGILKDKSLQGGAHVLLIFLPLFFVPATVGVMDHFGFLSSKDGLIMLFALLIGTILVLLSSGLVAQKTAAAVDIKTKGSRRDGI